LRRPGLRLSKKPPGINHNAEKVRKYKGVRETARQPNEPPDGGNRSPNG